jgi:hypothetical protein
MGSPAAECLERKPHAAERKKAGKNNEPDNL